MTDYTSHARRIAGQVRREVAPADRQADQGSLRVHIAMPGAKVMLLRGRFRDATYIRRHVAYVLTRDAEQGEQHVLRNLRAIRRTLQEMGVEQGAIDAEIRTIEGRVRAEIWRQVLTPDGQP